MLFASLIVGFHGTCGPAPCYAYHAYPSSNALMQ